MGLIVEAADRIRTRILDDLRSALEKDAPASKAEIDAEYARVAAFHGPRPVVDGILVEQFIEKHEAVRGTTHVVQSYEQVPGAVQIFLAEHGLPPEILMSKSDYLERFDWPQNWQICHRKAQKSDAVSVTGADCAIAETGTIFIVSSPKVSSTHLFLPENHIAIFDVGQVVRHLEDAFALLTESVIRRSRGIHMITGPSKTADVEQTIQYGAHGPRRVHAIIVDSVR